MNDTPTSKRPLIIALASTSVIVILAVGGYFYLQQKPNTETTAPPAKTVPVAPIAINAVKTPPVAEALSVLFNVKATSNQVDNAKDQRSSLWFEQSFNQGKDKFHAFFVKTQNIDPDTKTIADSHVDGANISVIIYQQVGEQWQFFSKQINVGSFGSWGDVPDIKTVPTLQLSAENLAFLIDSGFTGQGYSEEGYGVFSFNVKAKTWKDLGFVQTGGDNAGACDDDPKSKDDLLAACWKFTGEISLAKTGKNPVYPDLLVKQKGTTSDDNNKIIPVSNRLYVFNGEQYVADDAESR